MELSRRQALKLGALTGAVAMIPLARQATALAATPTKTFKGSVSYTGGFTVPAGQVWSFDPNASTTVVVRANVVVAGTLVMRPANPGIVHTLRFEGIDESRFVGGPVSAPLASDVGLWVIGDGILDLQGSPKVAWNRTGTDVSWSSTDELIVAPNAAGDLYGFRAFTKGQAVPFQTGPNGVVYKTEVANLTRNVRIEGTETGRTHVMFLESNRPQVIRHVSFRHMGPQKATGETYTYKGAQWPVYEGILGRYGLHFHCLEDGSRGSLIEGVVVRDAGGRAFVPHSSHGMTFRDCIAFDVRSAGFWWDPGFATNDITFDKCAVFGVPVDQGSNGYDTVGFFHNLGAGNVTRGCVAVGVFGDSLNAGAYMWPSSANGGSNVWTWDDNIAHNNQEAGVGVWQNDSEPHVVTRYVGYHNGIGISHGAYINSYVYRDCVLFRNGTELIQHALGPILFERTTFDGNVLITKHSLASSSTVRYVNCKFTGMINIAESRQPGVIRFESSSVATDLRSDRFIRTSVLSSITVKNANGSTFAVR